MTGPQCIRVKGHTSSSAADSRQFTNKRSESLLSSYKSGAQSVERWFLPINPSDVLGSSEAEMFTATVHVHVFLYKSVCLSVSQPSYVTQPLLFQNRFLVSRQ